MTTPDLAVLLLSTTGSAAFLLAGISAGRGWSRPQATRDAAQRAAEHEQWEGQLAAVQQQLAAAEERAQAAQLAAASEKRRADTAAERANELGDQVTQLRAASQQSASPPEKSEREAELEEEVKRLRGLLDSRAQPGPAVDATALSKAKDELQKQLDKANQDLGRARRELATERSTRLRQDTEINQQKEQISALEKELEKFKLDEETHVGSPVAAEAIRELARLQKELKQTQEALSRERDKNQQPSPSPSESQELADMKRRLDEVTSEKEDLEVRQEASAGYVRRAQAEAKQQREQVEQLRKDLEAARSSNSTSDQMKQALGRARESAAELVKLKQQLAQAQQSAKNVDDAKQRTEQMEREMAQLRSSAATQAEQLRKELTERGRELDAAKAELAAARSAVKTEPVANPSSPTPEADDAANRELRVRLGQAETRAARVDSLEEENRQLKDQLDEARPQALQIPALTQRIVELEAKLFATGKTADAEPSSKQAAIDAQEYPTPAATQNTLRGLLEQSATRSVVLADSHGLPIGAEGDTELHEGLAAVTGLIGQMASQASQLLPLGVISTVTFQAQHDLHVACRLFECDGDAMALATLGTAVPAQLAVERVVAGVVATFAQPPSVGA